MSGMEPVMLGAALGGGSSLLTGKDPLKGALFGGLTSGLMGGLEGTLGSAGARTAGEAATAAQTGVPAVSQLGQGTAQLPNALSAQSILTPSTPFDLGATKLPSAFTSSPLAAPTPFDLGAGNLPNAVASLSGPPAAISPDQNVLQQFAKSPLQYAKENPWSVGLPALAGAMAPAGMLPGLGKEEEDSGPLSYFKYDPRKYRRGWAEGGITSLASGGYDKVVGDPSTEVTMASGGLSSLGSYSDGGRMLRGPGDGMSDSIPASISDKQPARLADGEFVVPADVVSHLGNGSTDAGAKQLYAMMDKVRKARTGTKRQGREIRPAKYMPA